LLKGVSFWVNYIIIVKCYKDETTFKKDLLKEKEVKQMKNDTR